MGYYNVPLTGDGAEANADPDARWYELADAFHVTLEHLLRNLGVERYGNVTYQGPGDDVHEAEVKVQLGSGEEMDLTCARELHGEIVHYASTRGEGWVETVHQNGWVTVKVRARL